MKISLMATAAIAISVLSACGGDLVNKLDELTGDLERDILNAPFKAFTEQVIRYDDMPVVPVNDIIDTAVMQGFFQINDLHEDGILDITLGVANATADFEEGSLNGVANNFAAYETTGCTENLANCTGNYSDGMDGSLLISGTITGDGFDYNINGELSGVDESDDGTGFDFTANINTDGAGTFGIIDYNLVAIGTGNVSVELKSAGQEDPNLTLQGVLYLEEGPS